MSAPAPMNRQMYGYLVGEDEVTYEEYLERFVKDNFQK